MKRVLFVFILLFLLLSTFTKPVYALCTEQEDAIQNLLDEAVRKSGGPSISVSLIHNEESSFFSSGYANLETKTIADENTFYELASVSKAFTGTAILLLEEQGHLSMTDSIDMYLPWLNLNYDGQSIDMQSMTLNHFLHHTSGLTNEKHFTIIPEGNSADMLLKTVESINNVELDFSPGERYNYGTINYDVLGLVIEVVSGKSYETFMIDEIFKPIGMNQTYLYVEDAQANGEMAQGYRRSFFITTPFDAPTYAGNKPAGYIISNAKDMARWMQIQMGNVNDIPDSLISTIENSHIANKSVAEDYGMYYGGGWLINNDSSIIEHGGVNPTFSTQVTMYPSEGIAITVLSNNSNNNNFGLAENILNILNDNLDQTYERSAIQLGDIALSVATIIFMMLSILFVTLGLKRYRNKQKQSYSIRKVPIVIGVVITLALLILTIIYPSFIDYNWPTLLIWQPYSLLTFFISLTLLSASFTYFISKGKVKLNE